MIISPEKILLGKNTDIYNKKIFLVSGNEETYIKKIEKKISSNLFQNKKNQITRMPEKAAVNKNTINMFINTLFHTLKTFVFYNPKDIDYDFLKSINDSELSIIICLTNQKSQNKLIKSLEKEKNFAVIKCYKLSAEVKKLYFDNFLSKHSLCLDREGYWFFLDNTSNYYQLFENEMLKLLLINLKKTSVNEIKLLIARNENHEIEKLFFLILKNPKEIILQTSRAINSESDSYILLQRVKFFTELLIQFKTVSEITNAFPKYLFREKSSFLLIFNKINSKKILKIFSLIKKTEITLRKQGVFYSSVCQRFMINLSRSIK